MSRKRDKSRWTFSGDAEASVAPAVADRATRAIKPEGMGVVFQPIVDLHSGMLFAVEALARCRWPEFKSPLALFSAAEEERSCGRLGRVIREVAFAGADAVPLFVNVHPQELNSRWLVRPDDPLNFHTANVFLEITESAALDHFELVSGTLKEICSRTNARLVIDDFGAGYSNLKRVVDLEPAVVKLDRALIVGLHRSVRQQTLVRYVVRLCEELGAQVVAEGIEAVGELRAVIDTGCHYGQGYLLAKPDNPIPRVLWPFQPSGSPQPHATRLQPPPKPPVLPSGATPQPETVRAQNPPPPRMKGGRLLRRPSGAMDAARRPGPSSPPSSASGKHRFPPSRK